MNKTYIIAEIANAAQGDYEKNFELIDAAVDAGVDAVKFQFYKYDSLCVPSYPKYEIYKDTFYTAEEREEFVKYAKLGDALDVWIDIFDEWGYETFLKVEHLVDGIKIPPTVIFNEDLAKKILRTNKEIAVGVGGCTDEKVNDIVGVIEKFARDKDVCLMHGYQGFPTKEEDLSISRIAYLRDSYGYRVGMADHVDAESELALRIPEYAVCAGAEIIEKHIFLDRSEKGYDYYSALHKNEMKAMVHRIRRVEKTLGDPDEISDNEKEYLVHAVRATSVNKIDKGSFVGRKDIAFRRCGNSESMFPQDILKNLPVKAVNNVDKDRGLTISDVESAKVGIVALCRLNSTRLPRKALLRLGETNVISNCLSRCKNSKRADVVVLATSDTEEDSELSKYAYRNGVEFFTGSPNNPAKRILQVADKYDLDYIVRTTGDSPVVSSIFMDYLLRNMSGDYSYFTNIPLGVRSEVFKVEAIRRLMDVIETEEYSEYLTLYFKNNPDFFDINPVTFDDYDVSSYQNVRLTVDYPEDYELLCKLFELTANDYIDGETYMKIATHEDFFSINSDVKPKYENTELRKKLDDVTKIKA